MHLCSGMAPVMNYGLEIYDSYQCISLPHPDFVCRRCECQPNSGKWDGGTQNGLKMSLQSTFPMNLSSSFYVSSLLLMDCFPSWHAIISEHPFPLFQYFVGIVPAVNSSLITFVPLSFERKPSPGSAVTINLSGEDGESCACHMEHCEAKCNNICHAFSNFLLDSSHSIFTSSSKQEWDVSQMPEGWECAILLLWTGWVLETGKLSQVLE